MDYLLIQDFLVSYSLPTLIIAVIVLSVSLTLNKFFDKLPVLIKAYLPFFFSVALYIFYDCVFVIKSFSFRIESVYAGLLSGSLSVIISSSIKKIGKGKPLGVSATILLIEGILEGYVLEERLSQTALEIESALLENNDSESIKQQVIEKITTNSISLSSTDIISLSNLIINAVQKIKKT